MDVAVVYESLFGNTRLVAEAIADGIRAADPAARVSVTRTDATKLAEVDDACLLVVGGPTHMRRMTSPRSRRQGLQAARKTKDQQNREPEPGTAGPGLREWLQALPPARLGALAAAFDTRVESRLAGSAARPASRQLKRRGFGLAGEPEGFIVTGLQGPLRQGELDRARTWGAALARHARRARPQFIAGSCLLGRVAGRMDLAVNCRVPARSRLSPVAVVLEQPSSRGEIAQESMTDVTAENVPVMGVDLQCHSQPGMAKDELGVPEDEAVSCPAELSSGRSARLTYCGRVTGSEATGHRRDLSYQGRVGIAESTAAWAWIGWIMLGLLIIGLWAGKLASNPQPPGGVPLTCPAGPMWASLQNLCQHAP